jgi:hypothetical protein
LKNSLLILIAFVGITTVSCRKEGCTDEAANNYSSKAKKDDGSCTYDNISPIIYTVPSTFSFTDTGGNSTVSFGGQTDRLNQLSEMVTYMKTGTSTTKMAMATDSFHSHQQNNSKTNALLLI